MKRLFVIAVFVLGFSLVISSDRPEDIRYQPSGIAFPEPQRDFSHYVSAVRAYLEKVRVDVPLEIKSQAVAYNMPQLLSPPAGAPLKGRFLLIHGLSDSPYSWHDMAQSLSEQGFETRTILLPGHGSRPGEMLAANHEQWLAAARKHLEYMREDDIPLYVGGFSMGGVLATQLALENPDLAGLLLVAPAWQVDGQLMLSLTPWLRYLKPWAEISGKTYLTRYSSYTTQSYAEFYALQQKLLESWAERKISVPTAVIAAKEDLTVNSLDIKQRFQKSFISEQRQLIWYDSEQISPEKLSHQINWAGSSHSLHILSQSHISMMNAPENKLYGHQATVRFCKGRDAESQQQCMANKNVWYGAWHIEAPDKSVIARTTYNPMYQRQLTAVLETLTQYSDCSGSGANDNVDRL